MNKISTCLWFDGQAEEAAKFYTSIFGNSRISNVMRGNEFVPGAKPGNALLVEFELEGRHFQGLNGGPNFKFTEAISLVVDVGSRMSSTPCGTSCSPAAAKRRHAAG